MRRRIPFCDLFVGHECISDIVPFGLIVQYRLCSGPLFPVQKFRTEFRPSGFGECGSNDFSLIVSSFQQPCPVQGCRNDKVYVFKERRRSGLFSEKPSEISSGGNVPAVFQGMGNVPVAGFRVIEKQSCGVCIRFEPHDARPFHFFGYHCIQPVCHGIPFGLPEKRKGKISHAVDAQMIFPDSQFPPANHTFTRKDHVCKSFQIIFEDSHTGLAVHRSAAMDNLAADV